MEPLELDNNIKTEVELLKKDVHSISKLVDKLDISSIFIFLANS